MTRVSKSVVIVLGLMVSFAAGHVTANGFATRINEGFLNAFNSAGQNLFGSAVFGAQGLPPDALPPGPEDRPPDPPLPPEELPPPPEDRPPDPALPPEELPPPPEDRPPDPPLPPEELPPPPEPEAVQVDFLTNSQIRTLLNVVEPPEADAPQCRVGLQVEIAGDGSVSVIVDPDVYDPDELIEIGTPTGGLPHPCASIPGFCADASDCPEGDICVSNRCEVGVPECTTNEDCGVLADFICVDGQCVPF